MKVFIALIFISNLFAIHDAKVIICGVCKNVEHRLPYTIRSIEKLGEQFKDYRVFIYENNSTDHTTIFLKMWAEKNRRVWVRCENLSKEEIAQITKPGREPLIARARNIVLDQAMQTEYEDYSYVIMADMDFPEVWDIGGIMSSFSYKEPWDAILANGVDWDGYLYDRFAYKTVDLPLGPQLIGWDPWIFYIRSTKVSLIGEKNLVPVSSAFGGLGIYKREALKGCRYSGVVTPEVDRVNYQLLKEADYTEFLDQNSIKNTDNRWVIGQTPCCEHEALQAAMRCHGHAKIYINPQMIMRYYLRY